MTHRSRLLQAACALLATVALTGMDLAAGPGAAHASTSSVKTITPGVLTVAEDGDMPYTGLDQATGKMIGVDGEFMEAAARDLRLKVKPVAMDWAPEVPSVQSNRVDTLTGGMYYTATRARIVNITNPCWYDFTAFIERSGSHINTVPGLKGHPVGTVQGFLFVPDLQKISYVGPSLHLYQTIDAALQDLASGRIAVVVTGAASGAWHAAKRPEWKLKVVLPKPDKAFHETLVRRSPRSRRRTGREESRDGPVPVVRRAPAVRCRS
jgi:ABC-type amino acid transport substrate-binding protein